MRTNHEIFEDLVLAEASAWLVRLQSPSRTAAADAAFRAWLAEDVTHARAFARVTETWDIIPGAAQLATVPALARTRPRRRMLAAVAACLLLALVGGGITFYALRNPVYQTAVGGQQTVTLDDGTRITLNTDTRLTVAYSKTERRILLDRGEAIFDDTEDSRRPFIVQAGDRAISALGTTFDVRNDPHVFEVTLIDGKVKVGPAASGQADTQHGETVLSPGERVILRPGGEQTVDRPNLEEITAWQRGELIFDDATLGKVVSELNRYGNTHVFLGNPALAQLRVSGVFVTRDPVEAANAIARLHNLNVMRSGQGVVITQ
ncbi:FecR domain-containing protein [Rhodanobacter sp. Si-c]|uniref:FecR domain-containing protein n=1 Tax=Rhodanobacter lycopersici TaxID=3162487 RepID=A0ABV3Q969_9GAMM